MSSPRFSTPSHSINQRGMYFSPARGSLICEAHKKKKIANVRKTGSDISTTLIQGFNFTNSRFQLHEFTISTSRIHDFNFTNSTS